FTGNGYPDMVRFGRSRKQAVLAIDSNNTGVLQPPVVIMDVPGFDNDTSQRPDRIGIGDLDLDGRSDVVVPTGAARSVIRFMFDGVSWQRTDLAFEGVPVKLALFEMDGDGALDLLAVDREANAIVRALGDEAGGFAPQLTPVAELAGVVRWLETGDLDRDGWTDAVVLEERFGEDRLTIAWNLGDGTFSVARLDAGLTEGEQVVLVDVNGDTLADLVVTTGEGGNATPLVFLQRDARGWTDARPIGSLSETRSVARFDWNGDGTNELLLGPQRGSLGDPLPTPMVALYESDALCRADVTMDGRVNFFDLAAFLGLFAAADPAADLAEPAGVFDVRDVLAMLESIGVGCP
ncbi:MAG: VCBS repeat-containing protein, partial [Planctomycetota bacterium]